MKEEIFQDMMEYILDVDKPGRHTSGAGLLGTKRDVNPSLVGGSDKKL
jgi:hypothetical protein